MTNSKLIKSIKAKIKATQIEITNLKIDYENTNCHCRTRKDRILKDMQPYIARRVTLIEILEEIKNDQ